VKFKTIANLNLRANPSSSGPLLATIPLNTIVDATDTSDPNWKKIMLADGKTGYSSATYLQAFSDQQPDTWHVPVAQSYFVLSQTYLHEDWSLYPKFGHHTGVDYGGHGQTGIPLFACADGEIVYRDAASSPWGQSLGNHAALYVPSVDKSFLYCHMAAEPHALGAVKSGDQIGVMGNTGKSAGGAIHLHLEGFHGKFVIAWRSFISLNDIKNKTLDANEFIREHLALQ
jgi:murein DD-endopeptidase MepM/ murein hydrolase activator NlpD